MPVSVRVIERTRMSACSRQQVKRFNGWGKTEYSPPAPRGLSNSFLA